MRSDKIISDQIRHGDVLTGIAFFITVFLLVLALSFVSVILPAVRQNRSDKTRKR